MRIVRMETCTFTDLMWIHFDDPDQLAMDSMVALGNADTRDLISYFQYMH